MSLTPVSGTGLGGPSIDLRTLDYVADYDSNLMCPICHCPFIEPQRLDCDHTFCGECLRRALRCQAIESKSCPTCRHPLNGSDFLPLPRFLVNMIDELLVKCPKTAEGCPMQMRRGDVQNHLDLYCGYADLPCVLPDCRLKVPRNRAGKKCQHEIVECEDCHLRLLELTLGTHQAKHCAKRIATCPFCDEELLQQDLDIHKAYCPEALIPCRATSIGCKVLSCRGTEDDHDKQCSLAALWPTMHTMTQRIDNQEIAIKSLRYKNSLLENGFANIQTLLPPLDVSPALDSVSKMAPPAAESASHPAEELDSAPFDSATHHLLSLHESLREELDRVCSAVAELDARSSLMIMNESLRLKEDMAHTNAVIGSMRMQLQWLTSARLQSQPRPLIGTSGTNATTTTSASDGISSGSGNMPIRRLSDSTRQDTKL